MKPHSSHSVYTPAVLRWYDVWVLGISNRFIWKCPTARLVQHYQQHVRARHLDVGVGTGYFLDRCRFPVSEPAITLLDVNPHALAATVRRIARYRPKIVEADLCRADALAGETFDSIGLNYVLHCLPNDREQKATAIANLARHLEPSGVLFGSTLLGRGVPQSSVARWLMRRYQRQGIFDNAGDDPQWLSALLSIHLENVRIECVGCVALFSGRRPK